jgi:hypothetical protein
MALAAVVVAPLAFVWLAQRALTGEPGRTILIFVRLAVSIALLVHVVRFVSRERRRTDHR